MGVLQRTWSAISNRSSVDKAPLEVEFGPPNAPPRSTAPAATLPSELFTKILTVAQEDTSGEEQQLITRRFSRVCKSWYDSIDPRERWKDLHILDQSQLGSVLYFFHERMGAMSPRPKRLPSVDLGVRSLSVRFLGKERTDAMKGLTLLIHALPELEEITLQITPSVISPKDEEDAKWLWAAITSRSALRRLRLLGVPNSRPYKGFVPSPKHEDKWLEFNGLHGLGKLESVEMIECHALSDTLFRVSPRLTFSSLKALHTLIIDDSRGCTARDNDIAGLTGLPQSLRTLRLRLRAARSCWLHSIHGQLRSVLKSVARQLVQLELGVKCHTTGRGLPFGNMSQLLSALANVQELTLNVRMTKDAAEAIQRLPRLRHLRLRACALRSSSGYRVLKQFARPEGTQIESLTFELGPGVGWWWVRKVRRGVVDKAREGLAMEIVRAED